MADVGDVFG